MECVRPIVDVIEDHPCMLSADSTQQQERVSPAFMSCVRHHPFHKHIVNTANMKYLLLGIHYIGEYSPSSLHALYRYYCDRHQVNGLHLAPSRIFLGSGPCLVKGLNSEVCCPLLDDEKSESESYALYHRTNGLNTGSDTFHINDLFGDSVN